MTTDRLTCAESAPYSVYTLTDGELGADDAYADEDAAYAAYDALVSAEHALRDEYASRGDEYAETTVHLYFFPWGSMRAETCITSA
mgnify:CR=1 FL=1